MMESNSLTNHFVILASNPPLNLKWFQSIVTNALLRSITKQIRQGKAVKNRALPIQKELLKKIAHQCIMENDSQDRYLFVTLYHAIGRAVEAGTECFETKNFNEDEQLCESYWQQCKTGREAIITDHPHRTSLLIDKNHVLATLFASLDCRTGNIDKSLPSFIAQGFHDRPGALSSHLNKRIREWVEENAIEGLTKDHTSHGIRAGAVNDIISLVDDVDVALRGDLDLVSMCQMFGYVFSRRHIKRAGNALSEWDPDQQVFPPSLKKIMESDEWTGKFELVFTHLFRNCPDELWTIGGRLLGWGHLLFATLIKDYTAFNALNSEHPANKNLRLACSRVHMHADRLHYWSRVLTEEFELRNAPKKNDNESMEKKLTTVGNGEFETLFVPASSRMMHPSPTHSCCCLVPVTLQTQQAVSELQTENASLKAEIVGLQKQVSNLTLHAETNAATLERLYSGMEYLVNLQQQGICSPHRSNGSDSTRKRRRVSSDHAMSPAEDDVDMCTTTDSTASATNAPQATTLFGAVQEGPQAPPIPHGLIENQGSEAATDGRVASQTITETGGRSSATVPAPSGASCAKNKALAAFFAPRTTSANENSNAIANAAEERNGSTALAARTSLPSFSERAEPDQSSIAVHYSTFPKLSLVSFMKLSCEKGIKWNFDPLGKSTFEGVQPHVCLQPPNGTSKNNHQKRVRRALDYVYGVLREPQHRELFAEWNNRPLYIAMEDTAELMPIVHSLTERVGAIIWERYKDHVVLWKQKQQIDEGDRYPQPRERILSGFPAGKKAQEFTVLKLGSHQEATNKKGLSFEELQKWFEERRKAQQLEEIGEPE